MAGTHSTLCAHNASIVDRWKRKKRETSGERVKDIIKRGKQNYFMNESRCPLLIHFFSCYFLVVAVYFSFEFGSHLSAAHYYVSLSMCCMISASASNCTHRNILTPSFGSAFFSFFRSVMPPARTWDTSEANGQHIGPSRPFTYMSV